MSRFILFLKCTLMVVANLVIMPIMLYNAYWTGEELFGQGNGKGLVIVILVLSSILSGFFNKWLVTLPAILCSLLAMPFAPWGLLTGPSAFLCGVIAFWLNPQFLRPKVQSSLATPHA